MKNQWFYKISSALLIVLMAVAVLPVKSAYAADTGLQNPTQNSAVATAGDGDGFETNPTSAYANGGGSASNINGAGDQHIYYGYDLSAIPSGDIVDGIEVRVDWYLDSTTGTNSVNIELSWDGGTTWTTAKNDNNESTSNGNTVTLGSPTDNWGHTWDVAAGELNTTKFMVRLTSNSSSTTRDFFLDWMPVRVYSHTPLPTPTTVGVATATAATSNSINVSMPYTNDGNANNTYTVEYKLSSDSTWTTFVTGAAHVVSPFATTITGLNSSTSYDVRVTWIDSDGVNGTNPQIISNVVTPTPVCSGSFTYTAPAGTDRVVVAVVSNENNSPTNVRIGGTVATNITSGALQSGNARIYVGYRVIGTSAVPQAMSITSNNGGCAFATTYQNINQTAGNGANNTVNSIATAINTSGSNNITTTTTDTSVFNATGGAVNNVSGGQVVYAINMNGGSADGQINTGTSNPVTWNFSELMDKFEGGQGNRTSVGESTTTAVGSATVTVTTGTAHNRSALVAFALNPALATPTLSITNPLVTYNGSPQAAVVTCSSGGAVSNILYAGSSTIPTNAGTYAVTADCAAVSGFTSLSGVSAGNFVINQIAPTASVSNTPQNYTGAAQSATVSCVGGGVASNILTGGAASQTDAGTYPVTADCAASTNYTAAAGLAAGNFVINQLTPTLTVTNGPVDYDGSTHAATVSCVGGGVASNISTGGAASQTNAGTYPVTADCAASTNYAAASGVTAGNSFVINQIAPTASVSNTPQNYTGAAQSATVSCVGGGVASNILTGGAASQTDAGTYLVTADCAASTNYTAAAGLAAGNFVINQLTPTLTVTNGPVDYDGSTHAATVSCVGGGVASNISTGGAASQTNAGTYPVTADCAASTNYAAASGVTAGNSFVINQIAPTASVSNTPQNYTGAAQSAAVSCSGGGVASNILTGGAASQTDAGTYLVTADCAASINYTAAAGLAAGNFVINQIAPTASVSNTPQNYTGAAQFATVSCVGGGVASNISTGGAASQTDAGTYPVTVDCAASTNYTAAAGLAAGNFVINQLTPTLTVTNGPVDYDGSTHAATVSCLGGGVASNISTGGAASQTNAGTYPVTADCAASTNYAAASGVTAGNSFVINQIAPTASVSNTPQNYTGAAQSATVSCVGGGVASNILTGGAASQTDAGTYPVTADCAASTNYTAAAGLAAGNFVINQIAPTASVTNTPQNYTGVPQSAVVSCSGGGVASNILTGGAASQTDVGTYPVTADCAASTNYSSAAGLAAGNFVINNVGQTINVTTSAPATASNGSTFDVEANATSGLLVIITTSGNCSGGDTDGTATITMTSGTGTCSVFYDQAGNKNYSAAPQVQEDVTATEGPVFTSANTTSFDAGFAGTFNITATGNPSTMVISEAGALPSGITLVDNGNGTAVLSGIPAIGSNGTYNLVLTANNGVVPNGTQNFTLIVKNGPVIGANGVNSTPDTGDGSVSENESIIDTLGITKLTVQFSQDVNDPEGDTDVKDVTNPANYLLVRSTAGVFATIDCKGGIVAPDIAISVDSVKYSDGGGSGPFIATLSINGGLPLNVVGFYRLYVCGTTSIVDAVNTNLILAGNGTTPGTDFQRNFRVATAVVTTVGGGGGGAASSNVSKTVVTGSFLIPVTGFAPNQITTLPIQPVEKAYSSLGQMTIEIPTLGIKFPIVGASIINKTWDLTWLKDNVAYLEGSAYPTTAGNTVLTAHVQDANKNLGPFSDIKGMQLGQKIYIHVNGQIYVYQVQENGKISTNNITSMFKHEEDSWITLVTCEDYNAKTGLYNSRRMVRAVLISVIPEKK